MLSGASVTLTSQVHVSILLMLLIIGN